MVVSGVFHSGPLYFGDAIRYLPSAVSCLAVACSAGARIQRYVGSLEVWRRAWMES
jgi:hypothetical protein